MARQRKTRDVFVLQGNYGYGHGWEDITEEYTRAEIRERLREYRTNAGEYRYRYIKRREPIQETNEHASS